MASPQEIKKAKSGSFADKAKFVIKNTAKDVAKDVMTFGIGGGAGLGAKAAVKAGAKVASKVAEKAVAKKAVAANARGLKAAKGPSLAKGDKKIYASSGAYERAIVKMKAQDNMILGSSKKKAYTAASKSSDAADAKAVAESKKLLAKHKAEENAKKIAKAVNKGNK